MKDLLRWMSIERQQAGDAPTDFQDACFSKTVDIRNALIGYDGKKQKKGFADAVLAEDKPTEHSIPI